MTEEIYSTDGGEITQLALGLFVHLARTRGPFRVTRAEMDSIYESMDNYRLQLDEGPGELVISVEPRD